MSQLYMLCRAKAQIFSEFAQSKEWNAKASKPLMHSKTHCQRPDPSKDLERANHWTSQME